MDPELDATFDLGTSTLRLAGDLDGPNALALREALKTSTDEWSRSIAVDLAAVDYLPSTALGALVVAMRSGSDAGHEVVLRAPSGSIAGRILTIMGLSYVAT